MSYFGDVQSHAESVGLTLAQLCAMVDPPVHYSTLWRWEKGRNKPSANIAERLMAYRPPGETDPTGELYVVSKESFPKNYEEMK